VPIGSMVRRNEMRMAPETDPDRRRNPTGDVLLSRTGGRAAGRAAGVGDMFEQLKRYVGFDEADAQRLRRLREVVEPHLPRIVDRFYAQIGSDPATRRIVQRGEDHTQALRRTLAAWLQSLLAGRYDEEYLRRRVRIGRVHVRVGLPQHYMVAAVEVIRQELHELVLASDLPESAAALGSLHKLLAIETSIMLASYQGTFVERVRQDERSAMRERLTQAEHLAQIGRLAASLAHEIKNPLAGISGAIQVIRDSMPADAPHRPILGEVLRQINRLDQTVKDLLVYARPVPPRFESCDLNQVVARLKTVLRREPAMQHVRLACCDDKQPLPPIEADENQIEQLLMNLILNAAHASSEGGVVTLRAARSRAGVRLEVVDQGEGMDEETRRRALEPFFTTKARGTGLGLPICRRIVETHGGTMSIESVPGAGTTVRIELPRHQRAPEREWA